MPSPTSPSLGLGLGCGLPAMPECGGPEGPAGVWGCCTHEPEANGAGRFTDIVSQAIEILKEREPSVFRGNRVLDEQRYMRGVASILEERFGVCAKVGGPGDEVAVKTTNGWSEQYDILLGSLDIRPPSYEVTCRPARF